MSFIDLQGQYKGHMAFKLSFVFPNHATVIACKKKYIVMYTILHIVYSNHGWQKWSSITMRAWFTDSFQKRTFVTQYKELWSVKASNITQSSCFYSAFAFLDKGSETLIIKWKSSCRMFSLYTDSGRGCV